MDEGWARARFSTVGTPEDLFCRHRNNLQRVYACLVNDQAPVQMRPCHTACCAHAAQDGPSLNQVAFLDGDGVEMAVKSIKAQPVIYYNCVTGEKKGVREDHPSALGRVHRRSFRRREIHARVRRPRLAIEHAPLAEVGPFVGAVEWQPEFASPQFFGSGSCVNCVQPLAIFFRALHVVRTQINESARHLQFFDRKVAVAHRDDSAAIRFRVLRKPNPNLERELARRLREIDSEQGMLSIGQRRVLPEGNRVAGPLGLDLGRRLYAFDFQPQQSSLQSIGGVEQELHTLAAVVRTLCASRQREREKAGDRNPKAKRNAGEFPFHTMIVTSNSAMRRNKFPRVDVM